MTATATRTKVQITATTTPNFYDVLSSDGKTHYPLLVTGPGRVVCGCWAGENHKNCKHRDQALETLTFIPEPVEELAPVPAFFTSPVSGAAIYADLLEPMGIYFCQCGAEIAAKGLCQNCRDHEELFGFVPTTRAA